MAIITIDKALIPYSFDMELGGRTYMVEIRYNARHDYFTIDLSLEDQLLVSGVKLVWGVPLFESMETPDFPVETIVVYGENVGEQVTWDTFGQSVHIHLGEDNGIYV